MVQSNGAPAAQVAVVGLGTMRIAIARITRQFPFLERDATGTTAREQPGGCS